MGFYQITLFVTQEQENAIMELFSEREWVYQKQDQGVSTPYAQSSHYLVDWEAEGLGIDNRVVETSSIEPSASIPFPDPVYTVKTEASSVIYGFKDGQDHKIPMINDCAPITSSDELSKGQQILENDTYTNETMARPLCLKTNDTCEKRHSLSITHRRKRLYTRGRKSKVASNVSFDTKRETMNDLNVSKNTNNYDLFKSEPDETATEENNSLILFTDVPQLSKPKSSSESVSMSCKTCGLSWKKLRCFKKHICKKVCPFCNKVFPHGRTGNFNKHVNFHILKAKKGSVTIANCKEEVSHTQSEENIASESNTSEKNSFKSQIQLENEFPVTQENLTLDKTKDAFDAERRATKFHCQICNHSFRRKNVFDTHLCRKVCPFCSKVFPPRGRENFDKHVKLHEDLMKKKALVKMANDIEAERQTQTKGCTESSANDAKQESLRSQIHSEKLPVTQEDSKANVAKAESDGEHDATNLHCQVCNHTFLNKKVFDKHRNSTSCKRVCEYCGKVFLRRQICKYPAHIRTHTKQKDHQCTTCGEYFYEKYYMRRHQRRVHGGERPHVCELCGVSFTWHAGN